MGVYIVYLYIVTNDKPRALLAVPIPFTEGSTLLFNLTPRLKSVIFLWIIDHFNVNIFG